jgi:hypothetical protein
MELPIFQTMTWRLHSTKDSQSKSREANYIAKRCKSMQPGEAGIQFKEVVPQCAFKATGIPTDIFLDNDTIQVNMGTAGFPPDTEPKLPFLGGPFLSQVYLTVDYENNIFSLAKTNRDSTSAPALRALACDKARNATVSSDSGSSSNNTPKIVGGAVGGALGLVAIAGLIFFFVYRRRKQPELAQTSLEEGVVVGGDKKDDVPRYTSPFSPYGAYPPPPPPESVTSMGSPYPYPQSHYSGTATWATSPPLPPQQLAANASERGDAAELGPGSPLIEETPTGTLSSNPAHRDIHTL